MVTASESVDRWERSETRTVRPFRFASDYLKDAALRLYDDEDFSDADVWQIEDLDPRRVSPTIRISKPPPNFTEAVGASFEELRLVVIIEDRFLKRSGVVYEVDFSDDLGGEIDLCEEAKCAASWRGDTRIHVAVILGEDRDVPVGYARRAGSWVARKSFRISSAANVSTFSIRYVDREWFRSQRLPETTTYLVEVLGDLGANPAEEVQGSVEVALSEEVRNALAKSAASSTTEALMMTMYTDIVTSVLEAGVAQYGDDPAAGSILDVLIDRLSRSGGLSRARIISASIMDLESLA